MKKEILKVVVGSQANGGDAVTIGERCEANSRTLRGCRPSVDLISNAFTGGTPDPVTFTFSRRNPNWAPHVPMEFESLAGDTFQCVIDGNTAVIS